MFFLIMLDLLSSWIAFGYSLNFESNPLVKNSNLLDFAVQRILFASILLVASFSLYRTYLDDRRRYLIVMGSQLYVSMLLLLVIKNMLFLKDLAIMPQDIIYLIMVFLCASLISFVRSLVSTFKEYRSMLRQVS